MLALSFIAIGCFALLVFWGVSEHLVDRYLVHVVPETSYKHLHPDSQEEMKRTLAWAMFWKDIYLVTMLCLFSISVGSNLIHGGVKLLMDLAKILK